jgi:hypothetical protein
MIVSGPSDLLPTLFGTFTNVLDDTKGEVLCSILAHCPISQEIRIMRRRNRQFALNAPTPIDQLKFTKGYRDDRLAPFLQIRSFSPGGRGRTLPIRQLTRTSTLLSITSHSGTEGVSHRPVDGGTVRWRLSWPLDMP